MEGDANSTKAVRRYGFVIDTTMCFGCQACVLACKVENNVSDGIRWNNLLTDGGDSPNTPGGHVSGHPPSSVLSCSMPTLRESCLRQSVPRGRYLQGSRDGRRAPGLRQVHRLPYVHVGMPVHGRAFVQLGRAEVFDRPQGRRKGRPRAPEARCGEVHYVLPPSCARGRACLRQCMQDLRAPLGGILTIPSPRCRSFLHRGRTNSCSSTGKRSLRCTTSSREKGTLSCLKTFRRACPSRFLLPDSGAGASTSASSWRRS